MHGVWGFQVKVSSTWHQEKYSSRPWSRALRNYWICFLLVVFLFLPPLPTLYVPVLVWLLMFSEGVGMWPACVSSLILLNVASGRLLVGVLLHFLCLVGALYFGECLATFFLLLYRGSDQVTCIAFSSDQGYDWGTCPGFLSTIYLLIIFSYIIK